MQFNGVESESTSLVQLLLQDRFSAPCCSPACLREEIFCLFLFYWRGVGVMEEVGMLVDMTIYVLMRWGLE